MATDAEYAAYAMGQIRGIPNLTYRKMFGEYSVYVGEKIVAFLADNQFFLKQTEGGRALIGNPVEGRPYPGAKPCFVLDELLDDAETITALIRITERELPPPKPKKKKKG
jgi:TfoX/Sxy family transcriptional regulator of competence genes